MEKAIGGNAGKRGRVLPHPSVPPSVPAVPPPIDEFDAPDTLTREERLIWLTQAPHAFAARTLTKATALSFERYCRLVVLEVKESMSADAGGPNHRGLLQRINALELQFMLTPCGKALFEAAPEKPVNVLDRFVKRK